MKNGFSLAEALVVMVIVAILFAAITKVITTKPKPKAPSNPHGYYECYRKGGGLEQRYVREGVETEAKSVSTCEFVPPGGIAFFNINSYSPDHCYTSFQPNINNNIKITFDENSVITIANKDTEYALEGNEDPDNTKSYFEAIHPDSMIYNNGSYRTGIMFSW